MYIRIVEGEAVYYSITDLLLDNPNVSFPETITDKLALEWGLFHCTPVPAPQITYRQNVTLEKPKLIEGVWYQDWTISDASEEEIQSRIDRQWESIRVERNSLLAESDWTQVKDSPLDEVKSQQWEVYRQALRDITLQEDPFNIIWPVKP